MHQYTERTLTDVTVPLKIKKPPLSAGRHGSAAMAELADAPDLGSGGRPCRFEPCRVHSKRRGKEFTG